jgi:hypothetical protein
MLLARRRAAATLAAVVALTAGMVNKLVLQPLYLHIEPVILGFAVGILTLVLVAAGPALGYLWLNRPLRRRPATFEQSPAGSVFVVPQLSVFRGMMAILIMLSASTMFPTERVPNADQVRLSTLPGFVPVLVPLSAVMALGALALVWLPGPSLMLTPAGVTLRQPLAGRSIPWAALFPGGPQPATRWTMPLIYRHLDGRPARFDLQLFSFDIDHVFLATVIRHYAEHPQHRDAVGTQPERERLESAYAAWRSMPVRTAQPA